MELKQLGNFLAVAEHGSFTAAAAALYISQPALSRSVHQLEQDMDVRLFHRLARGVRLTPAGEALVPVARKLRRDMQAGLATVHGVTALRTGRLDIASLSSLVIDPVAPIIGLLRGRHPGVSVRLVQPQEDRDARQRVLTGDCEIAFTDLPTSDWPLASIPAGRQQLLAVLPPGTEHDADEMTLAEFAERDLVFGPAGTPGRQLVEDHLLDRGAVPRIAVEVTRRDHMEHLVLAHAGSTLLPEPQARHAERHGAIVLPMKPALYRRVSLLMRSEDLTPAASAFVSETSRYAAGGGVSQRAPT
ncbi:LysR family transcriptional regulator [Microbacterium sp. NPDC077184]|uniref:LysR family transcriptional regulator n=1 Tax=Microbacterium sp. NPDC077184 TaxID=3154764 RepID=UPI00343D336A